MKYSISILILLCLTLNACKEKCTLNCRCYPTLQTTGYSSYELDTVIIRTFTPDSTFSNKVDSFIITAKTESWWYPVNYDTSKKIFFFGGPSFHHFGYNLLDYIGNPNGKNYDFEVVIPSDKRIYKIADLVISGAATNVIYCDGGSVSENTSCNRYQYVKSYTIDGNVMTFPADSNRGFVYINR